MRSRALAIIALFSMLNLACSQSDPKPDTTPQKSESSHTHAADEQLKLFGGGSSSSMMPYQPAGSMNAFEGTTIIIGSLCSLLQAIHVAQRHGTEPVSTSCQQYSDLMLRCLGTVSCNAMGGITSVVNALTMCAADGYVSDIYRTYVECSRSMLDEQQTINENIITPEQTPSVSCDYADYNELQRECRDLTERKLVMINDSATLPLLGEIWPVSAIRCREGDWLNPRPESATPPYEFINQPVCQGYYEKCLSTTLDLCRGNSYPDFPEEDFGSSSNQGGPPPRWDLPKPLPEEEYWFDNCVLNPFPGPECE